MPSQLSWKTLAAAAVVTSSLALSSHAVADKARDGSKATDALPDYSAGVRWFFMTADRDVPSHRLVQHLARHAAANFGGDVATDGEHIAQSFPAGAWLETPAPPSRIHAVIRQRAETLGDIPAAPGTDTEGFPLIARVQILDLNAHEKVVHCNLRVRLKNSSGDVIEATKFTGRGDYKGMHVFAAAIPDRVWHETRRQRPDGAAATYLVMTVNVGDPHESKHRTTEPDLSALSVARGGRSG